MNTSFHGNKSVGFRSGSNNSQEDNKQEVPEKWIKQERSRKGDMISIKQEYTQEEAKVVSIKKEDNEISIGRQCPSCGAANIPDNKFCSQCGKPLSDEERPLSNEEEYEMIIEAPVWIIVSLNKPLEKLYTSNVGTTLYEQDGLEKTSMIIMGYNPNESSEEHLEALNDLMEGAWKTLRRKPESLFKHESPYPLDKILTYLVKTDKSREISDSKIDACHLCGEKVKRMLLKKHITELCLKRYGTCDYCAALCVVENMEEHQMSNCPSYPVLCPQKCNSLKIKRSKIKDHLKTCANSIVCCEFKNLGCGVKLKRRKLPSHLKEAAMEHVRLINAQLLGVSNYLIKRDSLSNSIFSYNPANGR